MKITKKIIALLLAAASTTLLFASVAFAQGEYDADKYETARIGVQTGSIHAELMLKDFPKAEPFYFSSIADCVAALKAGKIDAVYADVPTLSYSCSMTEGISYAAVGESNDFQAFIAAKTDAGDALIAEFNEYLAKVKESGEHDALIKKWFDGSEEGRVMEDITALPQTNKKLIVATCPTFAPFDYVKDGKTIGFEMELLYGFCKESGYYVKLENVSFDGIMAGISSGKFDLGVSGFSITEERKNQVNFTDVTYASCSAIAFQNDEEAAGFFSDIARRFKATFIEQDRYLMFIEGAVVTLDIAFVSIIAGTLLGFGLFLLYRKKIKPLNKFINFFKWLIHGFPVVVFLMILFYIIFGNSNLTGKWVATIGFTIIFACNMHGLLVMGENAVDKGQEIAARALGYSKTKAFFRIVLPQSAMHFLPSFGDEVTSHLKATAVVGYIAVVDVTKVGDLVRGSTYDAFFPLIAVAIMYFILAWLLGLITKFAIRKVNPKNRDIKKVFKEVTLK